MSAPDPRSHPSDDQLQRLAVGPPSGVTLEALHAARCEACAAELASYRQLGAAVAEIDRPAPPPDFTSLVLARLPAGPPPPSLDDLVAVGMAVAAAAATAFLFRAADGTSRLLQGLHRLPGKALTEALCLTSWQAHNQLSVLLGASLATLLLGIPLWRLLAASPPPSGRISA